MLYVETMSSQEFLLDMTSHNYNIQHKTSTSQAQHLTTVFNMEKWKEN